jgi:dihydroneopterin aldolase
MDRIFINALAVDAVIGIYDWERKVKQHLEVDLEIWMDLRAAARRCHRGHAQLQVRRQARARVRGGESLRLVEALAGEIAHRREFKSRACASPSTSRQSAIRGRRRVVERGLDD